MSSTESRSTARWWRVYSADPRVPPQHSNLLATRDTCRRRSLPVSRSSTYDDGAAAGAFIPPHCRRRSSADLAAGGWESSPPAVGGSDPSGEPDVGEMQGRLTEGSGSEAVSHGRVGGRWPYEVDTRQAEAAESYKARSDRKGDRAVVSPARSVKRVATLKPNVVRKSGRRRLLATYVHSLSGGGRTPPRSPGRGEARRDLPYVSPHLFVGGVSVWNTSLNRRRSRWPPANGGRLRGERGGAASPNGVDKDTGHGTSASSTTDEGGDRSAADEDGDVEGRGWNRKVVAAGAADELQLQRAAENSRLKLIMRLGVAGKRARAHNSVNVLRRSQLGTAVSPSRRNVGIADGDSLALSSNGQRSPARRSADVTAHPEEVGDCSSSGGGMRRTFQGAGGGRGGGGEGPCGGARGDGTGSPLLRGISYRGREWPDGNDSVGSACRSPRVNSRGLVGGDSERATAEGRVAVQENDQNSAGKEFVGEANEGRESLFDEIIGAETDGGDDGQADFEFSRLDLKKQADFRVNYLKKLSYAQVWVPQSRRPPQHQTVAIFDWDDTLLCTTCINRHSQGVFAVWPPEVDHTGACKDSQAAAMKRQLALVEEHGINLLQKAMSFASRVFIVTNAVEGWVEYSASRYIPRLLPILDKITVISARHWYETAYPGEFHQWKIQAFLEVQKSLNNQLITNLISLGDSTIEMDAVVVMGKEFAQALIKTVKFREAPSPMELARQLELVGQKFETICMNARNLKIGLERKWNPPRGKPAAKKVDKLPADETGGGESPANP